MTIVVTYAIFGAVVVFGELITVRDKHSPAPHIHLLTEHQITVLIKLLMHSSCLQLQKREGKTTSEKTLIEDIKFS